jgi:hypothetical protein
MYEGGIAEEGTEICSIDPRLTDGKTQRIKVFLTRYVDSPKAGSPKAGSPRSGGRRCPHFLVTGNFFDREYKVFFEDKVVAEASRNPTFGKQQNSLECAFGSSYNLKVRPGVDYAFMVSLAMVLELIICQYSK